MLWSQKKDSVIPNLKVSAKNTHRTRISQVRAVMTHDEENISLDKGLLQLKKSNLNRWNYNVINN